RRLSTIVTRRGRCSSSFRTRLLPTKPAPPTTRSSASRNAASGTSGSEVIASGFRRGQVTVDIVHAVRIVPLEHAPDCVAESHGGPPAETVLGTRRVQDDCRDVVVAGRHDRHGRVQRNAQIIRDDAEYLFDAPTLSGRN